MTIHRFYRRLAATGMVTAFALSIEAIFIETVPTATANDAKNDVSAAVKTAPERLKWQSTVTALRDNCGNPQWSSSLSHSDVSHSHVRDVARDGCATVRARIDVPKGTPKAPH